MKKLYKIELSRKAQKSLTKLDPKYKSRVYNILKGLEINPFIGKPLMGEYKGRYSIRLWPYRILYSVYKNELFILIVDVRHRQGAYK